MSDLLADLKTDSSRPSAPARVPTTPALVLRLTPTRWRRPHVSGSGARWSAVSGPVQVELTF